MNQLSESKITILLDYRGLDSGSTQSLQQFIQKTKLDVELVLLRASDAAEALFSGPEMATKVSLIKGTEALAAQMAIALAGAKGAYTLFFSHHHIPAAQLIQPFQAAKKQLASCDLLVLQQVDKQKKTASSRITNALGRLLSPLDLRDPFSGVFMAKTEKLASFCTQELSAANSWSQMINLAQAANLRINELPVQVEKPFSESPIQPLKNLFSLRWNYFVSSALAQVKANGLNWTEGNSALYRLAFFVFASVGFILMPLLSRDFGSTWDEKAHNEYSQLAYNYLSTFGEDTAALAEPTSSADYIRQAYRFYGEQINTVSAIAYNWFGTGVYETRHTINSLYGFLGIIFVSLIAFELGSWRAACMAFLFMFFNPGWFGHSMNNPTDIPFALGFAWAGLFLIKMLRRLPTPKFSHEFWLAVGIGMGIASRVGAILLLAYLGLFMLVIWLMRFRDKSAKPMSLILPYAKIFLAVFAISYVVGILIWPYALNDPLSHPYQAYVKASENAFYTNNVELFEGKRMYMLTSAPWYYVIKFLGIGNPIYLLLGFVGSIFMLPFSRNKKGFGFRIMLVFMSLFPIAYAELSNLNYYNGWRHYLFILPSAVPLAALFFDDLMSKSKGIALGATVVLLGLMARPTAWFIANHPNQYVYFNELVGGLKGAFGTYETDYYSNSCREAAEWIAKKHPNDSLVVGINNEVTTAAYWAHQVNPKLNFVWTRETEEQKQAWDYLIMTSRTFSQNELLNGAFPPKGTVYVVEAEGVPLAAVVKRENMDMPLGYKATERNDFDSAIVYFSRAITYQPKDEEAWRMLGWSYLNKGNFDTAEIYLNKAIEIYPENFTALSNLGLVYFNRKEFQRAIDIFAKSTSYKENVTESWYYAGMCYMNLGNYAAAVTQLEMAAKHGGGIPEIYYYLAKAYEMSGSLQKAADAYQMALGINQNMVQAWKDLANVFNQLNQPSYAAECMKRYQALGGN